MKIKEEDKEYINAANDCFSEALYQFREGADNFNSLAESYGVDKDKMNEILKTLAEFCESFENLNEIANK